MPAFTFTRLLLCCSLALTGCSVLSLGASVAGAAIDVTSAVVVTGVKVTGKVIEKTIDVVTPDSPPPPTE